MAEDEATTAQQSPSSCDSDGNHDPIHQKRSPSPSDDGEYDDAGLKQKVEKLIEPYELSRDEPPFSASELIIMACVCHDQAGTGMTKSDILHWIMDNFLFYTRRAASMYVENQGLNDDDDASIMPQVVQGFDDAFGLWTLPVVPLEDESVKTITWTRYDNYEAEMAVPRGAGRMFLSRWLAPERKGTFPFLKLPPELRNRIYEMVFSLPASGISITSKRTMYLLNRPEDVELNDEDNIEYHDTDALPFAPEEQGRLLRLLLVNKQIFAEAMTFFYSLNHFRCIRLDGTVNLLEHLPAAMVQHVKSLEMDLSSGLFNRLADFPDALKKFAQSAGRLDKLELVVNDEDWLAMSARERKLLGRATKFTKYSRIPGFKDLAVLCSKADELVVRGQSDGFKAFVDAEIERLAKGPQRKAERQVGHASGQISRAGRKRRGTVSSK